MTSKEASRIRISGIAVREGISRNKRKYLARELKKFAPTLIGRPILKDHNGSVDSVIGKVTDAYFVDGKNFVQYEGWVKEDGSGIIEKIRDGRIGEVSIGAVAKRILKESEDSDILIPCDMEAMELSVTPVPGNKGTSIYPIGENVDETKIDLSDEGIKKMIEEFYDTEAKVTAMEQKRKQLGMSVSQFYAAPRDPPSASALPIFDPAHVRNAMARFNQTHFKSPAEKARARRAILRAAKKFGIKVDQFLKNTKESYSSNSYLLSHRENSSQINERRTIMESEELNMQETDSKVSEELSMLKEQLEALKKEKAELEEARRQDAIKLYKEKCEAKGIKPLDVSESSIETIKALTEQVEEVPEPEKEAEPKEEEPKSEDEDNESEESIKPQAQLKSKDANTSNLDTSIFEGYVLDSSDVVGGTGFAFYKSY
ncbi:MAG: hypothetical protein ACTSU7_00525 [Candidatus Heimdallarchaeaceae archaeon]